MLMSDYQTWLVAQGEDIDVDGLCGPATRGATKAAFVNLNAPAVTDADVATMADGLGCTLAQIRAVAEVESGGAPFDKYGRPKTLFERHWFDRFTDGQWSVTSYSNPKNGGYNEDSWEKLAQALCKDIDAAFKSASWGEFQVMGFHFAALGFCSPLEMAWSTVQSEAAHYRLFLGYVRMTDLEAALRQVSNDPDDCRPFAEGYNGPGYESGRYHEKIAAAHERWSR